MQASVKTGVSRLFQAIPLEQAVDENSPVVEAWIARSTQLTTLVDRRLARDSREFYSSIANLMGASTPSFADPPPADIEAIHTSLAVTGVVGLRKRLEKIQQAPAREVEDPFIQRQQQLLAAGIDSLRRDAQKTSGDAAGGAASRHAGDGARNQIQDTARLDRRAQGWIRITSMRPCYFCAMLASRGPVYKESSFEMSDIMFTGEGRHKVHDSCACSMRPIYTRNTDERPTANLTFEGMWRSLSDELGHSPTLEEWRSHYEKQVKPRV